MKKCPYCAESIRDEAIVCRWCGRDLSAPQGTATSGSWSRSRTLLALGGVLMAVGPFISWVSVPFLGSLNLFSLFAASDGAEGAAWVPVVLGAAVALSAATSHVGGVSRALAGTCGLLIGLLAVPLAVSLANEAGRSGGFAELGLGSWATAAGAVLMLVGAVTHTRPLMPARQTSRAVVVGSAGHKKLSLPARPEPFDPVVQASAASASADDVRENQVASDAQPPSRKLLRRSVVLPVLILLLAVTGLGVWRLAGSQPQPTVDTSAPGWATLAVTSDSDERPQVEVPLVWTDQARVCWDVVGDLEKFQVSMFGNEVSEDFETRKAGSDCRYFSPLISHASATDCATVTAFHEGDVEWMLVVQQEQGEAYGLSGINSTYQYSLLDNPCTGDAFDVPPGFLNCDDGTYAKSESDCTWAERQFEQRSYEPAGYPDWTCYPDTASVSMRTEASFLRVLRERGLTAIDPVAISTTDAGNAIVLSRRPISSATAT